MLFLILCLCSRFHSLDKDVVNLGVGDKIKKESLAIETLSHEGRKRNKPQDTCFNFTTLTSVPVVQWIFLNVLDLADKRSNCFEGGSFAIQWMDCQLHFQWKEKVDLCPVSAKNLNYSLLDSLGMRYVFQVLSTSIFG